MNQAEDRANATRSLRAVLVDQGDDEPMEQLYEIRNIGVRLYAVPRDVAADYHMRWDSVDWHLEAGPMPLPPGPAHWWRDVRIRARRFGVEAPQTAPEAALEHWGNGMSSGWYCTEHLEADLGIKEVDRMIPTLALKCSGAPKCPQHHEPMNPDWGCPVMNCVA